jgi:hypothetical protein
MTASRIARPPATSTFERKSMSSNSASPRPPAPARNASAASPTVVVTAIRRPAMISGRASGISTLHNSWRGVSPMPRPASRVSAGTLSSPTMKLRKRISSV